MILEYIIDYRSSALVYEKLFLKTLQKYNLQGKILREHLLLKCYVIADNEEILENFINDFGSVLPNSIFLYETQAQIIDKVPDGEAFSFENTQKLSLPFCLECLEDVSNKDSEDYYNPFKECNVCGYTREGENRSYEADFQALAKRLKDGSIVNINTMYGNFTVGIPSGICNTIACDLVAYDYVTIEKYMDTTQEELSAIASFEKPFIRFKRELKFALRYESVEKELFRCKLADDFILHFLMKELYALEEPFIFITQEKIDADEEFHIVRASKEALEPIEIVASKTHRAIVKGNKGLPECEIVREKVVPSHGSLFSIIKEHKIDVENCANLYMSKEHGSALVVKGKKYGFVNYLEFMFSYTSIKEIFEDIAATDEKAKKLIQNYTNKFPDHIKRLQKISWEKKEFSIYELWGIVAIILNLTDSDDIYQAAQALEDNHVKFLGEKGPRIDYKLKRENEQTFLDPLLVIRSGISFKLAGVDDLTLSYGFMESFVEFASHEFDVLKESMGVEAIAISGSMLENKKLFMRLCRDCAVNHNLYCNNELAVDGDTIFC